jgi:hypothetical protein
MASDGPGPARLRRPEDDFDQVERITGRVLRGAAVGVPVWILLLALLPFTGLGVMACLLGATAVAVAAVVAAERVHARRATPRRAGARGPRRRMSPLAAAGITLAAVLVVVYVIFVLSAG